MFPLVSLVPSQRMGALKEARSHSVGRQPCYSVAEDVVNSNTSSTSVTSAWQPSSFFFHCLLLEGLAQQKQAADPTSLLGTESLPSGVSELQFILGLTGRIN